MSGGILSAAHDLTIDRSNIIDQSTNVVNLNIVSNGISNGFQILLDASVPGALHDSSARYPPAVCHPGTRREYIDKTTGWALNGIGRTGQILWMHGPAGVGKSAVAQSCADAMKHKLGATFFFSRNSRDNPNYFFTTISYQLATKSKSCRHILESMLHDDPTLVTKSIRQQFHDLIVTPLQELRARGEDVGERVIIIDGLDECDGADAQSDIIDIITSSVRAGSTPFLWIFFSRPEPHIVASFESDSVLPLELPVSRAVDADIMLYLTDELEKVRKQNGLSPSWLSEEGIWTIVELAAGLFIYAATVVRFIGKQDSCGPEDQLRAVLGLATYSANNNSNHPLSKLDDFYALIMRRVPTGLLMTVRKILFATTLDNGDFGPTTANRLSLSESQFRSACRTLHSVLRLENYRLYFYHASFMEFLEDPNRSGEFCIRLDCPAILWRDLLEKLNKLHACGTKCDTFEEQRDILITWPGCDRLPYKYALEAFFMLSQSIPLDAQMASALTKFNYGMIPFVYHVDLQVEDLNVDTFFNNIPKEFRHKIISPFPRLFVPLLIRVVRTDAGWERPYVLGSGKDRALCWQVSPRIAAFSCYQNRWSLVVSFLKWKMKVIADTCALRISGLAAIFQKNASI